MNARLDSRFSRALDEFHAKRILAEAGVPCVQESQVDAADQAVDAARRIGFPVVLKGCGEAFPHKTELGLVAVGLSDANAVRANAHRMIEVMRSKGTLLVQEMVFGKRELLVGMKRDAQFGPVISFGLGGIFAEALADISLRLAPLSHDEALSMLDDIRGAAILGAYRGLPAVDRDALAKVITAIGALALDRPDIMEIDINPLIVVGVNAVAVDALVLVNHGH